MKTRLTAALVGMLIIALSGCNSPQLSASETCQELKVIAEGYKKDDSHEDQKKAMEQLKQLSARASDSLKPILNDVAEAELEKLKDPQDQDQTKLSKLESSLKRNKDLLGSVCDL